MSIFKKIAKYRRLIKMIDNKRFEIRLTKVSLNHAYFLGSWESKMTHIPIMQQELTILQSQLKRLENLLDELNF